VADKIFRDPLYNYICIDKKEEGWLLKLLDTPQMQRLRRIHQLGVSHFTFPGADHSRLCHSLGVLHLMQQAFLRLKKLGEDEHIRQARAALLSAALLHDVGHGPFSHVFEPCLGINHEEWSCKIVQAEDLPISQILKAVNRNLPRDVADLIRDDCLEIPRWQKNLLSSQLDMDRLDYLRRDSLFTGAGYGHFDWYRIIQTIDLYGADERDLVWPEKAMLPIEEFIFSRYYMYHNVYFHKTTRGFEKLLEAMWSRAKTAFEQGDDINLLPQIRDFWKTPNLSVQQYLAIEEHTVLHQIQIWKDHKSSSALRDLACRFLNRNRLVMVEPPSERDSISGNPEEWEEALKGIVKRQKEYDPPELYCLTDKIKGKYYLPYYLPEKEPDVQSSKNAIRLLVNSFPEEISTKLDRLRNLVKEPLDRFRYYIPKDCEEDAKKLRAEWKKS
jgi:HD superfamily phosphohydrolase